MALLARIATLLDHRLAEVQAAARVPSLAAGIVRGGALVWTGAAGTPRRPR